MANLPNLTVEQIEHVLGNVSGVRYIARGGQKVVWSGVIDGTTYAIKFASTPEEFTREEDDDTEVEADPEVIVRASREVETMRDCASPYMVKLGPIGLNFVEIEGQSLLYFTEEFINGSDLRSLLESDGPLAPDAIIDMGIQMTDAIKALWELGKIHRDIKPGNIMRRTSGDFVLLDAGLAFDVIGESLSGGFLVGTRIYFSPEQFDYSNRRTGLDFRSDIFALGVTMYEMATGRHPFWNRGHSSQAFYSNVTSLAPEPPSSIVEGFPQDLDNIIIRMLGKSPHLRYRKCDHLTRALEAIRGH
ncbi:MAG: serine/threonine protein kinase [Pirellulales bacterium]|nr:serine/threonine protein kinase [Pirellulales bacterium]